MGQKLIRLKILLLNYITCALGKTVWNNMEQSSILEDRSYPEPLELMDSLFTSASGKAREGESYRITFPVLLSVLINLIPTE